MQKTTCLLLISCLTFNVFAADCPKNVQKVGQGTPAPCTGWHVSEPQMQKFARTDEELEKTKKLVQAQEEVIKLSEAEIDFYKQKTVAQQKELGQAKQRQFWVGVAAFSLGVLATGIAAKAAIESAR